MISILDPRPAARFATGRARSSRPFVLAALLGCALLWTPPFAQAAGYVVNTLADNTTDDAFCTLREAIAAANNAAANANCGAASAGDDTITFGVSGTITLNSQLPAIASGAGKLTIDGGAITISGNNAVGVLFVNGGATLTLQNLTITQGSTTVGGGIYIDFGATVTITNSTFSGNSASANGGGIYNSLGTTVTITNSTFSGNSASANGGGIYTYVGDVVTITNSTFSGNSANQGGGIYIENAVVTATNSIISGSSSGGDIFNFDGTLTVKNSILGSVTSVLATPTVKNSILAITDPMLGPLTGSPAYFPLLAGSPAIDAGDNAICAAAPVNNTSQNGVTRPQDGDGNGSAICDIGSYEAPAFFYAPAPKLPLPNGPHQYPGNGACYPLGEANANVNPGFARPLGEFISGGNFYLTLALGDIEGAVDLYIVVERPGGGKLALNSQKQWVPYPPPTPFLKNVQNAVAMTDVLNNLFHAALASIPKGPYKAYLVMVPAGTDPSTFDPAKSSYNEWCFGKTF